MNKKELYQEILCLRYHGTSHRIPMPIHKRAAQFVPFDALPGFGESVREASRFKEQRICLADDRREELDRVIQYLQDHLEERPKACLTSFFPVEESEYGCYRMELVRVADLDVSQRILVAEDGKKRLLDDIIHIEII